MQGRPDQRSDGAVAAALDDLDAAQRAAVTTPSTLVAVIAAAGSGKTRVLTRRITHRVAVGTVASEPYVFSDAHVADLAASFTGARVVRVDGQDLFWWGVRTPGAFARLRTTLTDGGGLTPAPSSS